jgi:purine-binding chemotaxis protein CheW
MDDFSGRLVLFRVGPLVCAAPATAVREILPGQRATRIPGAPAAVQGLINVRGELVTLIDGGTLLGVAGDRRQADGTVVLLRWGELGIAVTVDEVLDLVPLADSTLAPREDLAGIDPAIVRAVGRHGDRSFIVLDLDALFGPLMAA